MKKKIVALALVICMLAIAIVGGTLAYFTDTKTVENTFTAGKIEIALDEAAVENVNGDYVAQKDAEGNEIRISGEAISTEDPISQSYHLFPDMSITKDPTITVLANSEDAYVAAKVTITGDLSTLIPMEGATGLIDINKIADGGLIDKNATVEHLASWEGLSPVFATDKCYIYQKAEGNNTWTLYIFMKDIQTKKDTDAEIVLFDTLTIPADWDNEEMAKLNDMTINVKAYATQTNGFEDIYEAMTTAFKDDFKFN